MQIILFVMACFALVGGVDRVTGNHLGLGDQFEEGFRLLGSVALCQAGMVVIAPLLSEWLGHLIVPLYRFLHVDPAMAGSVLAIDMGGYQMALALADNAEIGAFSGIVGASMLGCTLTYTIPVGVGLVPQRLQPAFARGVMCGIIALPPALLAGGLICGLSFGTAALSCLPVLVLSLLLALGLSHWTEQTVRAFSFFARGIRFVTGLGLGLGAFQSLSGFTLVPGMATLESAMSIVSSIGIALLGSLPLAEAVRRVLHSILARTRADEKAANGMLMAAINITPALVSIRDMDEKAAVITSAFAVSTASAFTAHLGFTASLEPALVVPMLVTKLLGGFFAYALVQFIFRRSTPGKERE